MSGEDKKKVGDCTVGCETDVLHLVIWVSGTADPVNTSMNKQKYAASYEGAHQYWDAAFYQGIKDLVKAKKNARLFDLHGWSGDNGVKNRETAGKYLLNRLVGANGEKAFYEETAQKKKIHIHLIGHSHGGNVMNEMTKQMDALGDKWPAKWKVKSFTYLSTPFFQKLHQVKVGGFVHPNAEVLNVFCKYDMTQRMLADFSLYTLTDVLNLKDFDELTGVLLKTFVDAYKNIPCSKLLWLTKKNGPATYNATMAALRATIRFVQGIDTVAKKLNTPLQYAVDTDLKKKTK